MQWGLPLAVLAAVLTAAATILQAIGARQTRRYEAVDPRLLLSVLRSGVYVVGLIMLTASFVVTLVALHSTPLFVVQAINGASLAFIAALSWMMFRAKLSKSEWIAIGTVFAGIVLLVVAQRPSKADSLPLVGQWALLGAAVLLGVIAFTATRLLSGSALPALLAGLAFGDAAVGSRVIADQSMSALLASPATYAVGLAGLLGALLYATALQRGSVTAVFAASTVGQTLGPAATGWLLLGDSVQAGLLPAAAVGFGLTIAGAIFLARHAHPDQIQSSFRAWRLSSRLHTARQESRPGSAGSESRQQVQGSESRLRVAGQESPLRVATPESGVRVALQESRVQVALPESRLRVVAPDSRLLVPGDEHRSLIDDGGVAAVGRLRSVAQRLPVWLRWRGRARAAARATTP
jgi:drug/metabolite transporter (DMT)-like permease